MSLESRGRPATSRHSGSSTTAPTYKLVFEEERKRRTCLASTAASIRTINSGTWLDHPANEKAKILPSNFHRLSKKETDRNDMREKEREEGQEERYRLLNGRWNES
ncbi:hypothetical protein DMN91_007261 [Ooceraea biroi]|uniref:Uncharacterized protein n=1 Tax=Ooceraea biroi TaxID=2015173 RepID=A0A3L8DLC9_OOCBI|nr:uncharacterized protein LOC105281993 [Ooceraea biroi]RLU20648.1 hypothetical protein DMN91_007261 [Ooceraea biroi]